MSNLDEFRAGERLDDVAIFLSHGVIGSQDALTDMGEAVENGVVLVVPGDTGRKAFDSGTGMDPMNFAREAMDNEGAIDPTFDHGECPAADETPEADHGVEFAFAFAEAQNEDVGGLYAEGDVMHAYAHCSCGTNYADKWLLGDTDRAD